MSDANSDAITSAVKSLGLISDPVDERAVREVKWPQLFTAHQIRQEFHSSLSGTEKRRLLKGWQFKWS